MLAEKPWKLEAVLRLLLTLVVCFFVGSLLWSVVGLAGDKGWIALPADKKFINFVISALSFQGAVFLGLVLFLRECGIGWRSAFGWDLPNMRVAAGWGVLGICFALPITFLLAYGSTELLKKVGFVPDQQDTVKALQAAMPVGQTIVYGLFAVLLAPVAEEMIFRGVLYPAIKQGGFPRLALWGTALLFAATHANLMAFVPLTFLALVMTALYERTGNLIAPIVAHAMFNVVNFYLIVAPDGWKPKWFLT